MKKYVLLILFMFSSAVNAQAYQSDTVFIQELPKDKTVEAAALAQVATTVLMNKLIKEFPCLYVMSSSDVSSVLGFLKAQQLVGTGTDEEMKSAMDGFGKHSDAKYLISLYTSYNSMIGYRLDFLAWTRTQKGPAPFFMDGDGYATYDVALKGAESWADELVKAFVKKASNDRWDNEVCPFNGRVDVTIMTRRKQPKEPKEEVFYSYCNGGDWRGSKSKVTTAEGKQLWKLNRTGNPDTNGTVEYSLTETAIEEEVDGCHECASGRKGSWTYKDEVKSYSYVSGLDTSTYVKGVSDNKDATVRLHFLDDGTYTISVRAVSVEGKKQTTHTTIAEGTCDLINKSKTESTKFVEPLEKKFGPFTGTVFDKRLAEKKTLKFTKEEIGEETEVTIDFELERPKKP